MSSKSARLRQFAARLGIAGCDHGVVRRQTPAGTILLR
jgi:hypothetical protein